MIPPEPACPPLTSVLTKTLSPDTVSHLDGCPRCRALRHELDVDPIAIPDSKGWAPEQCRSLPEVRPSFGAVFAMRSPDLAELMLGCLVDNPDGEIELIGVTQQTDIATDRDVVLAPHHLGFPACLLPSVQGHVLIEQLDQHIGEIEDTLLQQVLNGAFEGLTVGPAALSGDDPRRLAARGLQEDFDLLFEPARSLKSTSTLGELITKRRKAIRLTVPAIAEAAGVSPNQVAALEADELDLSASLEPSVLGGLLASLGVFFSRALAQRIKLALAVSAPYGPTAVVRARRNARSPDNYRPDMDQYLALVERMMRERGR
jgi:transcriptional regulator with XRE-family HTH domain